MNGGDVVGWALLTLIALSCVFIAGWHAGRDEGVSQIHMEAVKRGSAHWGILPDGSPTFLWNAPRKEDIQ